MLNSAKTGWNAMWRIVGGILATIAQMVGVAALVLMVMGITLYYHEVMITKECVDTNKIALINNDYTIECKATPVVPPEE